MQVKCLSVDGGSHSRYIDLSESCIVWMARETTLFLTFVQINESIMRSGVSPLLARFANLSSTHDNLLSCSLDNVKTKALKVN